MSRFIYQTNHLPLLTTSIGHKDYPPGAAVFHYYVYHALGRYSEQAAYFAQGILTFSPLFVCFLLKHKKQGLFAFLLSVVLMVTYNQRLFNTMYVDSLVGGSFAAILIAYFYLPKNDHKKCILLLPAVVFLPLIKQVGLFLAVLALVIFFVDQHILLFSEARSLQQQGGSKPVYLKALLALLVTLVVTILFHLSWKHHYAAMGILKSFPLAKTSLPVFVHEFSGHAASQMTTEIQKHFMRALFLNTRVSRLRIPACFELLIFSGLFYLTIKRTSCTVQKRRYISLYFALLIGFIVYSAGLLILYINGFSTVEKLRLASFPRYMAIYLMAFCLVSCLTCSCLFNYFGKRKSLKVLVLITVVFLTVVYASKRSTIKGKLAQTIEAAAFIKSKTPSTAKIFLIFQNDTGDSGWTRTVLYYKTFPSVISGPYSFGKPYFKGDVYTVNWSTDQFKQALKQYDYLLLMHTDSAFWAKYGTIFSRVHKPTKNYLLFKIGHNKENRLRLERIVAN